VISARSSYGKFYFANTIWKGETVPDSFERPQACEKLANHVLSLDLNALKNRAHLQLANCIALSMDLPIAAVAECERATRESFSSHHWTAAQPFTIM
jgi:hypothetical protein